MKLVMATNLFLGMIHDILMEYYLQKYGYSCTGSYTMLPATMKLELAQSLKIWSWNPVRSDHLVSIHRKLHLVVLREDDRALWANSYKFDFAGK